MVFPTAPFRMLAVNLFVLGWFAAYANSLYHAKIKRRIEAALRGGPNASLVSSRLSYGAGVNAWVAYGFGAVFGVGIVAAVGLPAYEDYSKRHGVATVPAQTPTRGKTGARTTNPPTQTDGHNNRQIRRKLVHGLITLPSAPDTFEMLRGRFICYTLQA